MDFEIYFFFSSPSPNLLFPRLRKNNNLKESSKVFKKQLCEILKHFQKSVSIFFSNSEVGLCRFDTLWPYGFFLYKKVVIWNGQNDVENFGPVLKNNTRVFGKKRVSAQNIETRKISLWTNQNEWRQENIENNSDKS